MIYLQTFIGCHSELEWQTEVKVHLEVFYFYMKFGMNQPIPHKVFMKCSDKKEACHRVVVKPNPDLASPWLQRNVALRGACASVGGGRRMPGGKKSTLSLHKLLQPKHKMCARGGSWPCGNNSE